MTYSLTGNALAATRLKLALDARFPGDTDGVDRLFYEFAETLLHHANGEDARAVVAALAAEGRGEHQFNGVRIVLARNAWGEDKMGGYRSEGRRVGKECVDTGKSRWVRGHSKKKKK